MASSTNEDLASQRAKISKEIHDLKDELFSMSNNEINNEPNDADNLSASDNENENFYDVIDNAFEFNNKLENDQKMSEVSQFLKDHEKTRLNLVTDLGDTSPSSKSAPLKMLQSPSSFFNMRKSANKKRHSVISSPIIDESSHSTNKFFNNVKSERLDGSTTLLAIDTTLQEETHDKENDEPHKTSENGVQSNTEKSLTVTNGTQSEVKKQPVEQDDEKEIITYKKSFNENSTEENDQSNFQFDFEFSKLKIDDEKMKFSDSVQKLAERSTDELNNQYRENDPSSSKKGLSNDKNRSSGSISRKLKRYSNNHTTASTSSAKQSTSETNTDKPIKKKNETTSKQLINSDTMQQNARQLMMSKSAKKKWKGSSTGGYVLSKIFSIFGGK